MTNGSARTIVRSIRDLELPAHSPSPKATDLRSEIDRIGREYGDAAAMVVVARLPEAVDGPPIRCDR